MRRFARSSTLSLLGTTPWRRAPLLLRRHPAVAAGIAGATTILCAAAATLPLFIGSVESAALHRQLEERCQPTVGWTYAMSMSVAGGGAGLLNDRRDAITRAAAWVPNTGAVEQTVHTSTLRLAAPGERRAEPVRLMHRTRFVDRLDVVDGGSGRGLWLPHTVARRQNLGLGDRVQLSGNAGELGLPVVAIYRDLASAADLADDWCLQRAVILPPGTFSDLIPPPLVFTDGDGFVSIARQLGAPVTVTWELPLLQDELTLDQAQQAAAAFEALPERGLRGEAFRFGPGDSVVRRPTTELTFIVDRADAVAAAVSGAVAPVSIAGTLVALAMVASAGSYWVDRRRTEVALLMARGVGRSAIAVKALLEMLIPAALGGLAGWVAAVALARSLGPHPLVGDGAPADALVRAGIALLGGLLVLAFVVSLRAANGAPSRPAPARLTRRAPWEVVLLGLAGLALVRLREAGPPVAEGARVPPVDVLILAFPLLALTGGTALFLRLARAAMPWLRRRSRRWSPAWFLGTQRMSANRRAAALLTTAASLSAGVLLYSATLTGSTASSFEAKAGVYLGGTTAVSLVDETPVPSALQGRATTLFRANARTQNGQRLRVLAIDPATFADGAFWHESFASRSLSEVLSSITHEADPLERSIPAVIAGGPVAPGEIVFDGRDAPRVGVDIVDRVRAFPGLRSREPLVVVDRRTLPDAITGREHLLWADAPTAEVSAALRGTDARARFTHDINDILDAPLFYTVIWTFAPLEALGALTAMIMLGGLVLHLESRQRARVVSYGLARRMGLSRLAHVASIGIELLMSIGPGALVGGALALGAARVVHDHLDPASGIPPPALFVVPAATLVAIGGAIVAISALGALVAQRTADRIPLTEVMRLGR